MLLVKPLENVKLVLLVIQTAGFVLCNINLMATLAKMAICALQAIVVFQELVHPTLPLSAPNQTLVTYLVLAILSLEHAACLPSQTAPYVTIPIAVLIPILAWYFIVFSIQYLFKERNLCWI